MVGIEQGRPGRPGDAVIVTGSGTGIGLETAMELAAGGFRTIFNTNRDAGQTVFHIHLHLVGGRTMHWPPG